MKIKILTRNPKEHTREKVGDLFRQSKNADPALHPFEREREYIRALNSTKLDKVFAKPFVGAMDAPHFDAVCSMSKHPESLAVLLSGDMSGELRSWDLTNRKATGRVQAHAGFVNGIAFSAPTRVLTCGDDRIIKVSFRFVSFRFSILHFR